MANVLKAITMVNGQVTGVSFGTVDLADESALSTTSLLLGSSDASTAVAEITLGTGLSMTGSVLSASGGGSGDLLSTNNLSDVASAATSRTNLGLGTLATQSGTFSGTSSGTNTGDQTITLTGDVTGSGTGSFAATIGAVKVTVAKMSASATDVLFGRSTAGAGAGEEIACTATARSLLDDTSTSDMRTTLGLGTMATETASDYALLASPAFTGHPTGVTETTSDNSTRLATTAFATNISASVVSAQALLKTNNLSDLPSVSTARTSLGLGTLATQSATITDYALLASPAFTGNPTAATQTAGNNSTRLATTAYVDTADALKANLAGPTFTGTPAAPTASGGTNTTQIATTAFVTSAVSGLATLASPTFTGHPSGVTESAFDNSTHLATTAYADTADSVGDARSIPLGNGHLVASVGSNALTVAIKNAAGSDPSAGSPVTVAFRNVTAATGDLAVLTLTAATSFVVSSGSTMGTSNSTAFRLWVVGFNDGGTFRLGLVNCRSGNNVFGLRDTQLATSTAEGGSGAADSTQVIYTGTAVSAKAMRVLGYLEWSSGLGTAGTWSAVPTTIQLLTRGVSLPGEVVQSAQSTTGAVITGTTVVPADDTIPQISEGVSVTTLAFLPTSTTNIVEIEGQAVSTNTAGAGGVMITSVFVQGNTDAVASLWMNVAANNGAFYEPVRGRTTGLGTATLELRTGCSNAGTTTINGSAGSRFLGGAMNSYLAAREIMG